MSDTGYPPPHLIPRKTRVTTLPMMAFMGLIESAPISWEEQVKSYDVGHHHHAQHIIEHRFNGDADAYLKAVQDGSFRDSYFSGAEALDETSVPGLR